MKTEKHCRGCSLLVIAYQLIKTDQITSVDKRWHSFEKCRQIYRLDQNLVQEQRIAPVGGKVSAFNFSNEKPDLPRSTNQRGSIVIRLANGIAKSWWEGFRIPPPPPSPTTQTFGITQDFGLLVICALSSLLGLVDFKGKLSKNAQEIQRAQ